MNTNSTKAFTWKRALVLSLTLGLLTAGLSVFFQARNKTVQAFPTENLKAVAVVAAPVGLGSSFEAPGQPARIIIPAIGVNAVIQSVGLSKKGDGAMGIPTNFTDVAWYKYGPLPGMPGSAVIAGHLDGKKTPRAVFFDLEKLKYGDIVEVLDQNGTRFLFQVVGSKTYDQDTPTNEIFSGDTLKTRLNLITCAGSWMKSKKLYDKRIVVFTELVTGK